MTWEHVVTLLLGVAAMVAVLVPGAVAVAVAYWFGADDPAPFVLVPYMTLLLGVAAYAIGQVIRA